MVAPLRHRQTKGAETDMFDLQPPRHISTLPKSMCRNVRLRAAVGAIADVKQRSFYHPCFARRLGGVSGGRETQGWRDSSHTPMVGAGKFGSAKLPMATATYPGKPSPSQ
jgi:hypothetical protein